ncbi:hypothetical protein [Kitasatospora sp. NPDC001547]
MISNGCLGPGRNARAERATDTLPPFRSYPTAVRTAVERPEAGPTVH